uniref:Uncharacterized protein n=1 Tax=Candidozyma auris TaxID=498019 RepID=A0A0L0NPU1_CANAR
MRSGRARFRSSARNKVDTMPTKMNKRGHAGNPALATAAPEVPSRTLHRVLLAAQDRAARDARKCVLHDVRKAEPAKPPGKNDVY